jgi:hypothetical protein
MFIIKAPDRHPPSVILIGAFNIDIFCVKNAPIYFGIIVFLLPLTKGS